MHTATQAAHWPAPPAHAQVQVQVESRTSLASETRTALDTATAAYHLGRRPQTLREWACTESGPLRPMRVNGRLAWPVAELRRVLGVA